MVKRTFAERCKNTFFEIFDFEKNPTREEVVQKANEIVFADQDTLQEFKEKAALFIEQGDCYDYIPEILMVLQTRLSFPYRAPDEILLQIFGYLDPEERRHVTQVSQQFLKLRAEQELQDILENERDIHDVDQRALLYYLRSDNIDQIAGYHHLIFLQLAILYSRRDALQKLLRGVPQDNDEYDLGHQLILFAVTQKRCHMVPLLLEIFPTIHLSDNFINDDLQDENIIRVAVQEVQDVECIDLLLSLGATYGKYIIVNWILHQDFDDYIQFTPAKFEMLRYFIEREPLPPIVLQKLLADVCGDGNIEFIQYLIDDCGVDLDEIQRHNDAPLAVAEYFNKPQVVELLLDTYKVDPDVESVGGDSSVLGSACENMHVDIVRLLLQYDADPNITFEGDTRLPLQVAIDLPDRPGKQEIIDMLRQAGAKLSEDEDEVDIYTNL